MELSNELKTKYELLDKALRLKVKDDIRDKIEVEIGDEKDSELFQPQVKLKRWDNEVNVSLRLKDFSNFTQTSDKDKILLQDSNKDIYLYNIESNKELPEGGYEFEIILKEKPVSNVITFSLQTKGVKFHYQSELTKEEKERGCNRPDNVIGSYAIYTSEKKVNTIDGKEYKCGKVGHIYRPKITDSLGVEVWGKLNISNNILSVTIPQDFLDNAVYPIRHAAGLTFGYDTQGASGIDLYYIRAGNYYTSPNNGTLNSFKAYCYVALEIKAFVNQKDSVAAGQHGQIATVTATPTNTPSWQTFNFSSEAISSSSDYILNVVASNSLVIFSYDNIGYTGSNSNYYFDAPPSYSSPESPWVVDKVVPSLDNWEISTLYAEEVEKTNVVDGVYKWYMSLSEHTSAANNEPGVGVDWETYWYYEFDVNVTTFSFYVDYSSSSSSTGGNPSRRRLLGIG